MGITPPTERSATSSTWMTWSPTTNKRACWDHQIFQWRHRHGVRLDKCAKATFKKGRLADSSNIELDVNTIIHDLEQEGTYKYLGVSEGDGVQHSQTKEKIRKEYYCRMRMVLKSELNSANKLEAINTSAVPVVTYSFNIVNWTLQGLAKLDTRTRKFLTTY